MLQRCEAFRFIKVLESGRTRPVIIECECIGEDDALSRKTFVVKAFNLPEVDNFGLYCELLGTLFAIELGIETPQPALIELSKEFVSIVNPVLNSSKLSLRPGIGFGSEYISGGFTSPVAGSYLNTEEIAQAVNIFSFDLMVQNPDRLTTNPNCAYKNGKFVAFDFNLAFSFLVLIGKQNEPWQLSSHHIAQNHLFHRALSGKDVNWKPIIENVRKLTKERIEEICSLVPFEAEKWNEKVSQHLYSIVENADKLEIELQRSLL